MIIGSGVIKEELSRMGSVKKKKLLL
jgi:hypothetical protein